MWNVVHIFGVLTFISASTCHPVNDTDLETRILYGTTASIREFPFYAHFMISKRDGQQYSCGGSIISRRWILTAAHCLQNVQDVNICVGGETRASSTCVRIENFVNHPGYRLEYKPPGIHDIALVKLATDLQFTDTIQPVRLSKNKPWYNVDQRYTVVGTGHTESDRLSAKLLKTDVIEVPTVQCTGRTHTDDQKHSLQQVNICAFKPGTGKSGICNGDSGGPVVYGNTLYGIVSYVRGRKPEEPCVLGKYDMYVNVAYYVNWIQSTTGLNI